MKGRIALITGGMGDIGTVICRSFIEKGAKVIAVDRGDDNKVKAWQTGLSKEGHDIGYANVNVTDFSSCEKMAQDVEKRFGPVDILVNAAGVLHDGTLRKMTLEQWREVVHTDLDSMFNITRQFINGMIERHYGRIINISSVNGTKGQFGQTNYAAAKAGVCGFTKSLAQEVAKYGITVNAISPGYVESKMVMTIPENVRDKIIAEIPIHRLAKPEEIAWAIGFLADERSGYITGINLAVNGGVHMY